MLAKHAAKKTSKSSTAADAECINEDLGRRVKKLRADRGWSLDELVSLNGVSRLVLSKIERERANPTLGVSYRIARAFGLSLQDTIESAGSASAIQVTRADDSAQVFRSDKQCEIRTLSPLNLGKDIEFNEVAASKQLSDQLTAYGRNPRISNGEGWRSESLVQKFQRASRQGGLRHLPRRCHALHRQLRQTRSGAFPRCPLPLIPHPIK